MIFIIYEKRNVQFACLAGHDICYKKDCWKNKRNRIMFDAVSFCKCSTSAFYSIFCLDLFFRERFLQQINFTVDDWTAIFNSFQFGTCQLGFIADNQVTRHTSGSVTEPFHADSVENNAHNDPSGQCSPWLWI